jgi:hypothetical protein
MQTKQDASTETSVLCLVTCLVLKGKHCGTQLKAVVDDIAHPNRHLVLIRLFWKARKHKAGLQALHNLAAEWTASKEFDASPLHAFVAYVVYRINITRQHLRVGASRNCRAHPQEVRVG